MSWRAAKISEGEEKPPSLPSGEEGGDAASSPSVEKLKTKATARLSLSGVRYQLSVEDPSPSSSPITSSRLSTELESQAQAPTTEEGNAEDPSSPSTSSTEQSSSPSPWRKSVVVTRRSNRGSQLSKNSTLEELVAQNTGTSTPGTSSSGTPLPTSEPITIPNALLHSPASTSTSPSPSPSPSPTSPSPLTSPPPMSPPSQRADPFDEHRWSNIRKQAAELNSKLNRTQNAEKSAATEKKEPEPFKPSLVRSPSTGKSLLPPSDMRIIVGGANLGLAPLLGTITEAESKSSDSTSFTYRKTLKIQDKEYAVDYIDLPTKYINDDATFGFYCQKVDAFLLGYTISEPRSFDKVKQIVKRVRELQVKKLPVFVLATKDDTSDAKHPNNVQEFISKCNPQLDVFTVDPTNKETEIIEPIISSNLLAKILDQRKQREEFECMLADKTLVFKLGEGKEFKCDHVYLKISLADSTGNSREYIGQKPQSKVLEKGPDKIPVWNEPLEYNLKGIDFTQYEGVLLEVFNKASIGKDDLIGRVIWDWREMENLMGTKKFFQIKQEKQKNQAKKENEPKIVGNIGIGFGVKRSR